MQFQDTSQTHMQASNQRPIPLIRRADLEVATIDYLGVGYQVVKDPVALKYHRLQMEQYRILELLNGERSLEQVRDDLKLDFPTLQIQLSDIQQLITDLYKKGLLVSNRPGQGGAVVRERRRARSEKIKQTLMSLLYLRLPGWDPERTLRRIYPFFRWMFHPTTVWMCALFTISAWLLLAANFGRMQGRLPEFQSFFGWPNLLYLWATLGIAKIIHEFGHGLSCHHYGGECHEMGMMLLVFSPCLYCDVTDSWMMKNKWHRIIIGAAGMYIEVLISAVAIYVWWFSKPGLLNHLALNTFFVTTITTVIFNANPLMRFDGYYMMSDFLEIPNLRAKSDKLLREAFAWYCLGIENRPDPFMPETGRAWFITYAVAAWLYRWVILVSISMFLYTVLKPYDLQSIGITLCVASMAGIVFSMFRNLYQIISAPRAEPMSKPKIAFSLTVLGVLIWLAVTIQIPWHHEAPVLIEPIEAELVKAPFGGQILTADQYRDNYEFLEARQQKVNSALNWDYVERTYGVPRLDLIGSLPHPDNYSGPVRPNDRVEKGDILLILEDMQLVQERDELWQSAERWLSQLMVAEEYIASMRSDQQADVSGEISKAREEMIVLRQRIQELTRVAATRVVRAPVAGEVVAPPRTPEPERDEINRNRLDRWHGTPLDERNAGCFIEQGADLLTLAPRTLDAAEGGSAASSGNADTGRLQAVMYIDQSDLDDLQDHMTVEIKMDHLADVTYTAPVTLVSGNGEKVAPGPLTTRFGGPLATRPDNQGQEALASTAYRAIVEMHFIHPESQQDEVLFRPGMRGTARFLVDNRTAFQWLRRYFNETFRFRM